MSDEYSAVQNSERSYALWLKCAREQSIRRGQILPDKANPDEVRWAAEGERKPSELDSVRG